MPARLVVDHRERRVDAERRVVVERVVGLGAMVDDLVTGRSEVLLEVCAEVESRVVGRDVDAHGCQPSQCRGRCGWPPIRGIHWLSGHVEEHN